LKQTCSTQPKSQKGALLLLDLSRCQMRVNLEEEKQFLMNFMIPNIIQIQAE
jgi:hypothetical protein